MRRRDRGASGPMPSKARNIPKCEAKELQQNTEVLQQPLLYAEADGDTLPRTLTPARSTVAPIRRKRMFTEYYGGHGGAGTRKQTSVM